MKEENNENRRGTLMDINYNDISKAKSHKHHHHQHKHHKHKTNNDTMNSKKPKHQNTSLSNSPAREAGLHRSKLYLPSREEKKPQTTFYESETQLEDPVSVISNSD